MNKKYTIAAFSVLETAVGMVVSAIVIGLVFVVFGILSERMLDFKKQDSGVADLNRMTYSINKDIFESEQLRFLQHEMVFSSYSGQSVSYTFYPEYFLRTRQEFIDTFAIAVKRFRNDTIRSKNQRQVFQRITFDIDVNHAPLKLEFFRKINSNDLIKKDFDNEY